MTLLKYLSVFAYYFISVYILYSMYFPWKSWKRALQTKKKKINIIWPDYFEKINFSREILRSVWFKGYLRFFYLFKGGKKSLINKNSIKKKVESNSNIVINHENKRLYKIEYLSLSPRFLFSIMEGFIFGNMLTSLVTTVKMKDINLYVQFSQIYILFLYLPMILLWYFILFTTWYLFTFTFFNSPIMSVNLLERYCEKKISLLRLKMAVIFFLLTNFCLRVLMLILLFNSSSLYNFVFSC